ncbi:MAG: DUF5320 domain-containing protein [Bacteroidota bacterium]
MPRGDKTGPNGNGPMTGRRMGNCVEDNNPGRTTGNSGFGRGWGGRANMNQGMGRRFRNRNYGSYPENQEEQDSLSFLKEEIINLKNQISDLTKQIKE